VADRILLLTPSRGLGGGIERYVETVQWALTEQGIEHSRIDLIWNTGYKRVFTHFRLLVEARRNIRASSIPVQIIAAHPALLPVASLLAREQAARCVSVVCHGVDVWGYRPLIRRRLENHLIRRRNIRAIAVSSFTAGMLARRTQATILSPGLSKAWFNKLVEASALCKEKNGEFRIVTSFRLESWRRKGLPELLNAVHTLSRNDVRVIVCGTGKPPAALQLLAQKYQFCDLKCDLSDLELASHFASADLFVLATRTRTGRNPSGEGFGMVLLEAQIAGTPVVGPAYGGSHDAYIDGVTGTTPVDESAGSLSRILDELLSDREKLAWMGNNAADWARETFAPENYAPRVAERLVLGSTHLFAADRGRTLKSKQCSIECRRRRPTPLTPKPLGPMTCSSLKYIGVHLNRMGGRHCR
jgi:phosphatidyl-myo-inositol dimannoside synthase